MTDKEPRPSDSENPPPASVLVKPLAPLAQVVALKSTASGSEIRISCAGQDNGVLVSAGDTGCGIPEEKLESIFEPFVQVDRQLAPDSTSNVHSGVGLGLAISRELARAMDGDVSAQSSVGAGSVLMSRTPPPRDFHAVHRQ